MAKTKLKSCPFCGTDKIELTFKGNDYMKKRSVTIRCRAGCNVSMTVGAIRHDHDWCEKIAIEQWNQRVN